MRRRDGTLRRPQIIWTVDTAYRAKYGHYASIVHHLEEEGPRAASLEVHPD